MSNENMRKSNDNLSHDTYGNWLDNWNDRMEEIDGQIVSWWNDSWRTTSQSADELYDKVASWWDDQTLSEKAKADWIKARADRKVLEARIEQRVTHLVQDGKVKLAKLREENKS